MVYVNFILTYRSIYLLEIKTTDNTPATIMSDTYTSCMSTSFITVNKNLSYCTLGQRRGIFNSNLSRINELSITLTKNFFKGNYQFRTHNPRESSSFFVS